MELKIKLLKKLMTNHFSKIKKAFFFFSVLSIFSTALPAQKKLTLSNPNSSKETVALFSYLNAMYGKKILSGQMWSSWGIDELKYVKENTGKLPALRGMDFIHDRENEAETQRAIDWWKAGGIPTIMWHWGAPGIGEGYENSKKKIEIDNCFIEGTAEYKAMWYELEKKADLLQKLKEAKVPILWRPFHELNGNWFWWGKQGPEKFRRLWITMYDYFVNKRKLNNLIWVLCYTGNPDADWFPGKEYVDIAGADTYANNDEPQIKMYNGLKKIVGDNMPLTYHECGIPPDPDKCKSRGVMWSWWMEWHTTHLEKVDKEYLKRVYNHELVITLDEVPDIVKLYGRK